MSIPPMSPLGRVCVLVPTFNECDSLPVVLSRVRRAVPDVDIVVLDDNSPDGTGALADALAANDDAITIHHRPGKEGLGRAYVAGMKYALDRGYGAVVQIDADGSHQPEQLPALLSAADQADVVIGSRWVPGGAVRNWPLHRKALSLGGNLFVRVALGVPVRDATAGFRVYRATSLTAMGLTDVASHGYCFQVDLTTRAIDQGLKVVEVPIEFVEREQGTSKMGTSIVAEALCRVTLWGAKRRMHQARRALERLR